MSFLEKEITRLMRIIDTLTGDIEKLEKDLHYCKQIYNESKQESSRLEAWATHLFNKLQQLKA